jgi:allophanate hydrolase subunit 1
MKNQEAAFEERKEAALRAARAQGIVDVVQASNSSGVSLETLELATKLTQKHAPRLCKEHEERRKTQK